MKFTNMMGITLLSFLAFFSVVIWKICQSFLSEASMVGLMKDKNPLDDMKHYDIPLLDLWNESKTSTVSQRSEPPPESQWLKVSNRVNIINTTTQYPTIPKLVHKVYIEKYMKETGQLEQAHKSWTNLNPNYEVYTFNLNSCRKYLANNFHPIFLRTFDCINSFAGKADFFRMAVVYLEGGWYSDWKEVCLKNNLLDELGHDVSAYIVWDKGNAGVIVGNCVANSFFGASPRHPLIVTTLKMIMNNVRNQTY